MDPTTEANDDISFLRELEKIIERRQREMPEDSYTTKLFHKGLDKILQKTGEEAVEFIIDAKNQNKDRAISEGADLLYHFLVALRAIDINLKEVVRELEARHGQQP